MTETAFYNGGDLPEDWPAGQAPFEQEYEDDDPQCVCGVYRSEHSAMGCPEGFQTPAQWEAERARIAQQANRDEEGYWLYGDDEDDDEAEDDEPDEREYDDAFADRLETDGEQAQAWFESAYGYDENTPEPYSGWED